MVSSSDVAVVGAGPYGLSIAAHLRGLGIPYSIFGRPMYTWREQMPRGMSLKSDGFASNLSAPAKAFTLEKFCQQNQIPYDHSKLPVDIETFISYGQAFQKRHVPDVQEKLVTRLEQSGSGFRIELEDGSVTYANRVVLAVGITHFPYVPEQLANLSLNSLSHSSEHKYPKALADRQVTIIGAGASALDLAALMREAGVDVTVVTRRSSVVFHKPPSAPSLWRRIRWPQTGIGPGWKSRFFTEAPHLFHTLPEKMRVRIVQQYLGPSAGWSMKERVLGHVPIKLGYTLQAASQENGKVHLVLSDATGASSVHVTDHVVAATGYQVDIGRLKFLDPQLSAKIHTVLSAPILGTHFQSSVPGLYFVGIASAYSFGPMMRFAYGADYTANRIVKHLAQTAVRGQVQSPSVAVAG